MITSGYKSPSLTLIKKEGIFVPLILVLFSLSEAAATAATGTKAWESEAKAMESEAKAMEAKAEMVETKAKASMEAEGEGLCLGCC
jgi:hypothetical protein